MKTCPICHQGILHPVQQELICSRFPVCRHQEPLPSSVRTTNDTTYVVFDFETTGLSDVKDRVIEIGAAKVQHGQIVDEFQSLIHPGRYINQHIQALTGITNQALLGQPHEEVVFPRFVRWIQDADILVAHNLHFDARFLKQTCRRLDLPIFEGEGMDTLALAKKAFPGGSHKLDVLADRFGVDLTNAHRAIHDVRATVEVLSHLLQIVPPETKPFLEFCKR